MIDRTYLDLSDVMETFDLDETRRLLESQLESLHDDVCEGLVDNFKILYQRYTSIQENAVTHDPDFGMEVQNAFYGICRMFITRISEEFNFTVDEDYLEKQEGNLPSIALQFYLFFVLDLRSNLYNVLLTFISKHMDELAAQFESLRSKKDSITELNKRMENLNVALIASNIYDVVDWIMDSIDPDGYFTYMEQDYVALAPVRTMYESGEMSGEFTEAIRDILKENISMKGRICFDIICKLKGYTLA